MAWSSDDQNATMGPSAAYGGQTNYAAGLNAASYNPLSGGSSSTGMAPAATAASSAPTYADRLNAAAPGQPKTTSQALSASAKGPPRSEAPTRPPDPVASARQYLASVGVNSASMNRQGFNQAIGRMRPDFVVGLANAVRQARSEGIGVGPNSTFRDPTQDPGGYKDKWNSLHGYTMASDVQGIGGRGSKDAVRFSQIAEENGITNPYGPYNKAEYNHYQLIDQKGRQFREANPAATPALKAYLDAGSPVFNPPDPRMSPRTSPAFGAQGARGPMPNDYPEPTGRGYEPAPELAALWAATGYQGGAGDFNAPSEPMVASAGNDAMAGGNMPPNPRMRPDRTEMAYAPAPEAQAPFDAVLDPSADRRPQPPTPRSRPQRDTLQAPAPTGGEYVVQRGDNLTKIARQAGVSVQALARANGIRNPDQIDVGQRLVMPGGQAHAPAAPPRREVAMPSPRTRPERGANVPNPRMRPQQSQAPQWSAADQATEVDANGNYVNQPAPQSQPRRQGGMNTEADVQASVADYRQRNIANGLPEGPDLEAAVQRYEQDLRQRAGIARPDSGAADIGRAVSNFRSRALQSGVQPGPVLDEATRRFEEAYRANAAGGQPQAALEPGMDNTGLIRPVTAQERALQQNARLPLPTGQQPMDPRNAAQMDMADGVFRPIAVPGGPPWVASNGIRFYAAR